MPYKFFIFILIALLTVLFLISLGIGSVWLSPIEIIQSLFEKESITRLIFVELRLPRSLLAAFVGAALGLSGALLQGWLRNPLADPGVLGTTACAAFGGVSAIHTGLYAINIFALPFCGIFGAFIGTILIAVLSASKVSALTIILAGIALQALFGALTALALNLAPDPHTALEITFWLMGSVSERSYYDVLLVLPFLMIGTLIAFRLGRALDALSLGEETAITLGISLKNLKYAVLICTAFMIGSVTSVAGAIGFVGLAVPHLLRPIVGMQPSRLLLPSMLAGATLVLIADITVKLIPSSSEMKLGVLTSLIGVPFFFKILLDYRHKSL